MRSNTKREREVPLGLLKSGSSDVALVGFICSQFMLLSIVPFLHSILQKMYRLRMNLFQKLRRVRFREMK